MNSNSLKLLGVILALIVATILNAQEVTNNIPERPKIGLVLSGGGAKGLAHIGVLKVLEELNIRPDYITGTSMGSIVGGLYSIGYSSYQLDSLVNAINWNYVFSDQLSYNMIGINVKDIYTNYLLNLSGNSIKEIKLPMGLVHGQIISELLSKLTWRANGIDSFDEFPIPFRCVTADIISGKTVVFDSGNLAQAIRASMSIPSVFTPIVKGNMLLVDGGVIDNFPVQECIDMGADILIGVYVGTKENATANDYNTMIKILNHSASFLGAVNAREQMNLLDIKILPDLKGAGIESFNLSKEIIKMGEDAARQKDVYAKLRALSDSLKYFQKQKDIKLIELNKKISIKRIQVEGLNHVTKEFVVGISQIEENSSVSNEQLNEALSRLYATLIFDKIEYSFVKNGETYDLVFDVIEKDLIKFKASIYYDNYFDAGLLIYSSYNNLLINSSRTDLVLDISQYPRVSLGYNIFRGKRKRILYTLGINAESIIIPNYYEFPNSLIVTMGQFRNNKLKFYSSVGLSTTKNSQLEIKVSHVRNYFQLQGGLDDLYGVRNVSANNFTLEGSFKLNTLNRPILPTKGTKLDLIFRKILIPVSSYTTADGMFRPISSENEVIIIDYKSYIRIGNRFSLIPEFTIGFMSSVPFYADKFFLGGNGYNSRINTFNQTGVQPYEIATDNFFKVGLGFQLKLYENWYFNAFHQYARFINNSETFSAQSLEINSMKISGWAAGLAYDSVLGPLKFTVSQNINNSKFYYYLSLGFPF